MKTLRTLKKWVSDYDKLISQYDDLEVLLEFFKTGDVSEERGNGGVSFSN
jgi:hypothetical protein